MKFCNSVSFAGDTTTFVSGKNLQFLYKKINEDLKRLNKWFIGNSLSLNIEKSNYILFRTKNKRTNHIPFGGKIEVGGKEIKKVTSIKFLGVFIDEYLEWNIHVKYLVLIW